VFEPLGTIKAGVAAAVAIVAAVAIIAVFHNHQNVMFV
jgi:hypothetical protein